MDTKLKKNTAVIQANRLIEARYNLTASEQKLIFAMISLIQPSDADFKNYEIKLTELAELWDVSQKLIYREARKITGRLMTRVLHITEPDGTFIQVHWIALAVHRSGSLVLSFHPMLKPYLLQLKGAFTRCSLSVLNQFQSIYAIRLYQLLTQYKGIGIRRFEITELKEILGIEPTQYPTFQDFKRRIINQAKKELDAKADLSFELEGIAKGRKTTSITFLIMAKETAAKPAKPMQLAVPVERQQISLSMEQFEKHLAEMGDTLLLDLLKTQGEQDFLVRAAFADWQRGQDAALGSLIGQDVG